MIAMSSCYYRWQAAENYAQTETRRIHTITMTSDRSHTFSEPPSLSELRAEAHASLREYLETMATCALDLSPY